MNHSDISSAARLLRHALSPKDRPTPASQYRELLDRYHTDVTFAETVERIAEGTRPRRSPDQSARTVSLRSH